MPPAQLQPAGGRAVNQPAVPSGGGGQLPPRGQPEMRRSGSGELMRNGSAEMRRSASNEVPELAEQLQAALSGFSRDFNGNGDTPSGSGPSSATNTRPQTPSQQLVQAQPPQQQLQAPQPVHANGAGVRASLPKKEADALERELGLAVIKPR